MLVNDQTGPFKEPNQVVTVARPSSYITREKLSTFIQFLPKHYSLKDVLLEQETQTTVWYMITLCIEISRQ